MRRLIGAAITVGIILALAVSGLAGFPWASLTH